MNHNGRKKLQEIQAKLEELKDSIQWIADEEQEKYDNLTEEGRQQNESRKV